MPHDVDFPDAPPAFEAAERQSVAETQSVLVGHGAVPPVATAIPAQRSLHGTTWTDEYAWMRDQDSPEFASYLRAEREYHDSITGHLAHLSAKLYDEVEQRLQPTDESVSWRRGDGFYYTKTVAGSEYGQLLSTRDPAGAGRVVLDEGELAAKLDAGADDGAFVAIGVREVSPDGRLLAYSVDTAGDEVFTLRFRDLTPDRDLSLDDDLDEVVPRSYYGGAWTADSSTFYYTVHDALFRPFQVWRHHIGTHVSDDVMVYLESDPRFEVTVRATRSGRYVLIESASRDTTETWLASGDDPYATPVLAAPRRRGIEYALDHAAPLRGDEPVGDHFTIVTNDGAEEFRLMWAPTSAPIRPLWTELAPPRPGERLRACHALAAHLLLELRRDGFPLLRLVDRTSGEEREITADLPAGQIRLVNPFEYSTTSITVRVESLVEPPRWYGVDLRSGDRLLRKSRHVPGYDPGRYVTERRHVTVAGGVRVPVTLAWRADTPLDGTAPAIMWGYGAYESCDDPEFNEALPSLLDRGVVYALTHPRGGGELGRRWWLDGRLGNKQNTFTDHIAVADWLAATRLVDGDRIATRGLSAGGLLQGAVLAMRPDRWAAVVAEVPFVDVVTSMLDPTVPLTINEWDEWGDPRRPDEFAWLRGYSPYDNVPSDPRPAVLVDGGAHEPRVMVHEPAKWVARLRATHSSGDGPVLFRVELGAGAHTGPSGRYAHYRYESDLYAFVLDQLGVEP